MQAQAQSFTQRNIVQVRAFFFEFFSMALFAYGIVCSKGNDAKLTLAFFGALALCAPFSGGHINPAVTLGIFLNRQISSGTTVLYWIAQFLGAFVGAFFCFLILEDIASPMVQDQSFYWLIADLGGEALGTFTFVLIILIQCNPRTQFSDKPVAGLVLIALALHLSRFYTSHSGGCINPGMALSLEVFQVLKTGETERFRTLWIYIAGPFAGSIFSVIFYRLLYLPVFNKYNKK